MSPVARHTQLAGEVSKTVKIETKPPGIRECGATTLAQNVCKRRNREP